MIEKRKRGRGGGRVYVTKHLPLSFSRQLCSLPHKAVLRKRVGDGKLIKKRGGGCSVYGSKVVFRGMGMVGKREGGS